MVGHVIVSPKRLVILWATILVENTIIVQYAFFLRASGVGIREKVVMVLTGCGL